MTNTSSSSPSDSASSITAAAAATCEWEKFVDDSSQTPYYYNARTGESSWSEPEGFVDKSSASKLPSVWRKFIDESAGTAYYYDEANDVTQWEKPDGFVDDASDDDNASDVDASDDDNEGAKAADDTTKETADDAKAHTSQEHEAAVPERTEADASEDNANSEKPSVETATSAADEPRALSETPAVPSKTQATSATATAAVALQQSPSNWVKHVDRASGKAYYHDTVSGVTQWEAPAEFVDAPPMAAAAAEYHAHLHRVQAERMARVTRQVLDPTGSLARLNAVLSTVNASTGSSATSAEATGAPKAEWQQHVDPHTQRLYYHNVVTGVTQWHKPDAPISSGLADWIPPETTDPTETGATRKTVSGVAYAATAKFNRISGKFEPGAGGGDDSALPAMPFDRAGRQMSHFFDMTALEKNRADAKVLKEKLKRQHIDWKKVAAEKKAKKQKQKNEWLYQE